MEIPTSVARLETRALGREWVEVRGPSVLAVTRGELVARIGDEIVRAGAMDLLTLPPGTRCSVRAARGSASAEQLWIDEAIAGRALELGDARLGAPGASPEGALVEPRGTDRARRASRLLRELASAGRPETASVRLARAARCLDLLALLAEPGPALPAGRASGIRRRSGGDRFLRAVGELPSLPYDELTLPGFARRAGLSPRHASRLFQIELGRSFRDYLCELRIERAKELLRATEQSVIEVAAETGWSSLAHFNAVFRRRVGTTPTRFRGSCSGLGSARPANTDRAAVH